VIKIKALILAAGYATRLHHLTENQPKPLLNVAGKPIVEHILEKIECIDEIEDIFIVTNHKFYDFFRVWLNGFHSTRRIILVNDGTISNETRLGSVGDLNFVLKEHQINDDLLVIAGDNLFGFSLQKFVDYFKVKGKSVTAFCNFDDKSMIRGRFGVGILQESKVINFEEKPLEPKSTLVATACYVFTKDDLGLVEKAVERGKADHPGDLIKFLVKFSEMHGFVFDEHWFDVGSFEQLKQAEEFYNNLNDSNDSNDSNK
jgi:glucose-1-phosphate thymidylyltransferase